MTETLKTKRHMYNDLKETFSKFFVVECITVVLSRLTGFLPDGLTTIVSLVNFVVMIALLVFFIQYISKVKGIAKLYENSKLKNSMNMIIWGFVGIIIAIIGFVVMSTQYIVQLVLYSGLDMANIDGDALIEYLFTSGLGVQAIIGLIVFVVIILAFTILTYVGNYKEFTGHIIELEEVDEEVVMAFRKAQQMYLCFLLASLVLSGVGFTGILSGLQIIVDILADILAIVVAIVPLVFKKKAFELTILAMDARIEVLETEAEATVEPVSTSENNAFSDLM